MTEDHSLDDVLNYVNKLLRDIKKNKDKFLDYETTAEVEKKLTQLEKDVDQFVQGTEDMLKQAGITEREMKHALWKIPEELPEEKKEWLKRARELREEIQDTQQDFKSEVEQREGLTSSGKPPHEEKPKTKSNKSKFKRLGGDKWKPL